MAGLTSALAFYCWVLGFDLMQRYGDEAAFLCRRLPPLHCFEHLGKQRRVAAWTGHDGVYHFAIRYPTRATLADGLRRLIDAQATMGLARPSTCVTLTSLECCRVFGTLSCSRTWGTSPLMSRDRRSFRSARTSSRTCHNDTGTLAWRYPAIAFSVRHEKKQGVVSWLAQPPESHQRIGLSRMQLPGHGL